MTSSVLLFDPLVRFRCAVTRLTGGEEEGDGGICRGGTEERRSSGEAGRCSRAQQALLRGPADD